MHYGFYVYLAVFSRPDKERSTGFHQPVGPCGETIPVQTPFGQVGVVYDMSRRIIGEPDVCSDKERSTCFHQPVGPCGETVPVQTPFGQVSVVD